MKPVFVFYLLYFQNLIAVLNCSLTLVRFRVAYFIVFCTKLVVFFEIII